MNKYLFFLQAEPDAEAVISNFTPELCSQLNNALERGDPIGISSWLTPAGADVLIISLGGALFCLGSYLVYRGLRYRRTLKIIDQEMGLSPPGQPKGDSRRSMITKMRSLKSPWSSPKTPEREVGKDEEESKVEKGETPVSRNLGAIPKRPSPPKLKVCCSFHFTFSYFLLHACFHQFSLKIVAIVSIIVRGFLLLSNIFNLVYFAG